MSWKQIGHVLDRPSQLNLDGLELSQGIFAPSIRYNEANQTFYVVCTVMGGIKNFVVKTQDLSKGWSEPILLPQIQGIDPSFYFDEDGKAYITNSGPPPVTKWQAHKAIWLVEYDTKTDKVVGERKAIVDGGVDTATHPIWLEGSHIYKVNGKYYVMAAEGGTAEGHSEVIFESDRVDGPYKPCKVNPILTQRNLPADRADKFTALGHADLVQTPEGKWYAVFLATRPYSEYYFSTGRETCLLPVDWKPDGPIILEDGKPMPVVVSKPGLKTSKRPSGNFYWKDDFNKRALVMEWNMARTPRDQWFTIRKGKLVLDATDKSIYDKVNPAFLGRRQQHMSFTASTTFTFTPQANDDLAGMVLFQNDRFNIVIGKTMKDGKPALVILNRIKGINEMVATKEIPTDVLHAPVRIFIEVNKDQCDVYYSFSQQPRVLFAKGIDIKHLSTKIAAGFVGSYVGMYATANSRLQ